ncbi:DUF2336 domain-containing protein [Eilatimonas milleporae]|uniref:Uncharacterized protein (DUF2336 family) n=1 Tax=Eilatimonas milleporae TaxID=911205 RepID=A0A3M0CFL3_9PROT|nr:DUF2336 domain-containing protein [Eilatimonas milleporae]RMB08391.1 uncharacterized protein (DUF2336 family) [Eilatimonas milleporae]
MTGTVGELVKAEELRNVELVARIEIARKVGRLLQKSPDDAEKDAAIELARLLAEDVSVSVREALSRELRCCRYLPKDIIATLARDIDQVSMPFVMASQAIDDAFLKDLLSDCGDGTQEAIARRQDLSELIAYIICDVAEADAVGTLMDNETANVSERACHRVVDRFPEETTLMEKMAARADLPIGIVERIIFKVSQSYAEHLMEKFALSEDYASYLMSVAKRQVFAKALEVAPLREVENYLYQLKAVNGLTSDILLNYLQNRNLKLFTIALAVLMDRDYGDVEEQLKQKGKLFLSRTLEKLGFSRAVIGVLLIEYER